MKRNAKKAAWFFLVVVLFGGTAPLSQATNFADSTRVNVLRQFDGTGVNLVSQSFFFSPSMTGGFSIDPGNNSSGWPIASTIPEFNTGDFAGEVFTLPGQRTISSIYFEKGGFNHSGVTFEGFDATNNWVPLGSLTSAETGAHTVPFTATTITKLRYTISGPATSTYFYSRNIEAFMPTGQTVDLTAGYNILRDNPSLFTATSSPSNAVWAPTNALAATLTNGNHSDSIGAVNPGTGGGNRAYVLYTFSSAKDMDIGHLGMFNSQSLANWELYTSNAGSLPGLTTNTQAGLTGAGWILQHAQVTAPGAAKTFDFLSPGSYKYALLVWNVQAAHATELELFAVPVPEPSSLAMMLFGGLALWTMRRKK